MVRQLFNLFIFGSMILCLIIGCPSGVFAQQDSTGGADDSQEVQANEVKTQQTLNDIHDLVMKMKSNEKRLDELEKSINQADNENVQTVPAQQLPLEKPIIVAPPVQEATVQSVAPVQISMSNTFDPPKSTGEKKSQPLDFSSKIHGYYEPTTTMYKEQTFELSQEDFYSNFKEPVSGGISRNGAFYGIYSSYALRPWDTENWPINVFHLDVHGDYGKTNYDLGGGDKYKNVNNYTVEPRVWLGKDFDFNSSSLTVTPYAGFGYRWYFDQLKNKITTNDEIGSNKQTQYIYIPVGSELAFRPAEGWRISLNAEYDIFLRGWVTSYLSNIGPDTYTNLTNTLKSGYGLRGSVKILKEGNFFNYFLEPYIRYWSVNSSNTVPVVENGTPVDTNQESKNHSTELGARLGVEF